MKINDYLGKVLKMVILCSVTIQILHLTSAKMHLSSLTLIARLCKMTFAVEKMYLICILFRQSAMHVFVTLFLSPLMANLQSVLWQWKKKISLVTSILPIAWAMHIWGGAPQSSLLRSATLASSCHCVRAVARLGTLVTLM